MVVDAFDAFFRRNISLYPQAHEGIPCDFVGSIAYHYSEILSQAADAAGFTMGRIERNPMAGLLIYHINEK